MPELPEVEVIRRGLDAVLPGKAVASVEVFEPRSFPGFDDSTCRQLVGAVVLGVARRGKMLMVSLSAPQAAGAVGECRPAADQPLPPGTAADFYLLAHLRMTGQLVFRPAPLGSAAAGGQEASGLGGTAGGEEAPSSGGAAGGKLPSPASVTKPPAAGDGFSGGFPNASLVGSLPDKSTRVAVTFTDQSCLYFNDQRKFGYLKLTPAGLLAEDSFLKSLGPEPIEEGFTWQDLRRALAGKSARPSSTSVKAALLDQKKLAGVGNIYADESLFRARIDPRRSVSSLSAADYKRLLAAIVECLGQSIADGGSTSRNYVDALGLRGEFLDLHAMVYGRQGQPCPRCGRLISKTRVAGRGTHLCESCQR